MLNLNIKITILKFIGAGFLFLAIFILSKKMSLYDYGIYETVVRISLLISTFSIFGSSVLITRAKSYYSAKKIFLNTFPTILIINIILIIISISIIYFFVDDYISGIVIILSGLFYTAYKLIGTLYLKKKKYFVSILSDDILFNTLLALSLLFLLFVKVKLTLFSVSLTALICRSLTFFILNSNLKTRSLKLKKSISLFKESTTLFKQSFSQKLVNNLPVIMCPFLFSGDEIGILALSIRFSGIYLIAISGFIVFITPNISEKITEENFIKMIKRSLTIFSITAFFIFLINLYLSNYIPIIWKEFDGYIHTYLIILTGYLVNFSTGISGVLLNQLGLEKKQLKVNILSILLFLFTFILTYVTRSYLIYVISISIIIGVENLLKLKYFNNSLK
jgi:O-antigen/teichoic acid export membrane protein